MNGSLEDWKDEWKDGRKNKWMEKWTIGRMNKWMNEWLALGNKHVEKLE